MKVRRDKFTNICEDVFFTSTFYKDIKVINRKEYYHEYLKSKRWKATREDILKSEGVNVNYVEIYLKTFMFIIIHMIE